MRISLLTVSLAIVGPSFAFPGNDRTNAIGCPFANSGSRSKRQTGTTFDLVKQRIDVSGVHEFRPPGPNDKRGPCPGLNAMANHGYISRTGITTFVESTLASNKVYGLGLDAGGLFSLLSVAYGGSLTNLVFSIGGDPAPGLSGTHNKMEGDASCTRKDAYVNNGDASSLSLDYFKHLYNLLPENEQAHFDMQVMVEHRAWTREQCISSNPHCFFGPVPVTFVSTLAHILLPRLVSNHSAEHPDGILNHDVLKTFYGITGNSGSLTYTPGHERIPENWYRRASDYTVVEVMQDFAKIAPGHPEFLSLGGNTGKVNSFVGVDPGDITGGIYNASNLLEGNNLMCFVYQALQIALLSNIGASALFSAKLSPAMAKLSCPELKQYNTSAFAIYPGAV
ncbi:chloroperoxidase [Rhizoctonia solani 123E]|uniref:Chloroperoxidase n=1 Tax=Rhizoctonia solani 123E TaxID=1423351 RepID=A0A074RVI8_9AGAM|nr:chloroperoxidase [Rhizoctonia solani 123E]